MPLSAREPALEKEDGEDATSTCGAGPGEGSAHPLGAPRTQSAGHLQDLHQSQGSADALPRPLTSHW